MKKPSNRDLAVAAVIALFTAILTWAICSMYYHNSPVTIENPANEALRKRGDSLEAVIAFRDSLINKEHQTQAKSDSIILANSKDLKKYYGTYKTLSDSAKHWYVDSLLRTVRIRK
jgi:hypothetical protein